MSHVSLLVATMNKGKLREVQSLLAGESVEIATLADFPDWPAAVEDGETFEDNARKKAIYYSALSGRITLTDDSGLVVDALDGGPGVYSARFAGPSCDDVENNRKLIQMLTDVPQATRTARYCCTVAVARSGKVIATASGTLEGCVIDEPRGQRGFGYDPHFLVAELNETAAELTPEHKNRISHRGQALRAILPQLRAVLRGDVAAPDDS